MPSFYDNTYHDIYRKPVYDNDENKADVERKRVNDEIYERAVPRVPTQEMENEYIDFLANDFRSDPWFTYRFRKYMAGPKRIPWKNSIETKSDYKKQFGINWVIGYCLFWPIACMIGRRQKRYQGGAPIVPYQRFIHDFPNLEPTFNSQRIFKFWAYGSSAFVGYVWAHYKTDDRIMYNPWYNRPDLKPYAAMVEQDDEEKAIMHTLKMAHYQSYRAKEARADRWRSPVVRYFFPNYADWTIRSNPYVELGYDKVYSLDNQRLQLGAQDYLHHQQE